MNIDELDALVLLLLLSRKIGGGRGNILKVVVHEFALHARLHESGGHITTPHASTTAGAGTAANGGRYGLGGVR